MNAENEQSERQTNAFVKFEWRQTETTTTIQASYTEKQTTGVLLAFVPNDIPPLCCKEQGLPRDWHVESNTSATGW